MLQAHWGSSTDRRVISIEKKRLGRIADCALSTSIRGQYSQSLWAHQSRSPAIPRYSRCWGALGAVRSLTQWMDREARTKWWRGSACLDLEDSEASCPSRLKLNHLITLRRPCIGASTCLYSCAFAIKQCEIIWRLCAMFGRQRLVHVCPSENVLLQSSPMACPTCVCSPQISEHSCVQ